MATQWSPWFSWFMDLAKFVLTFGVTAIVTLFGINSIQERRARQRNRADALFQLQMDALREFRRAAATYDVAALSAYTDVYQWKGGDKTPAMQRYEGMAYGDVNAALDGLEIRFKDSTGAERVIEKLRDAYGKRYSIYDVLVDTQLDEDQKSEMWIKADKNRKEFDSLLDEATNLRKSLLAAVEADILRAE